MTFPIDHLIFTPDDVDLARSPLAGKVEAATHVLGAFNPGMTRLANGNLLLMVRVAEALTEPIVDGHVRSMRWDGERCRLDPWPLQLVDTADPRAFAMRGGGWRVIALTSLSWLLPVELDADGRRVEAVHYDRAIGPRASWQCYGVEDARISRVGDRFLMTACSVSPERLATALYTSADALDWKLEGIVLDHQNKDMLIFEGLIGGHYWAQTRPLGELYFAYPPGSEWRAGPSINLASSPDALHWKPCDHPGIRPHAATIASARMGGGAPPVRTDAGWLSLWHGVEPHGMVGIYRTYWTLLDRDEPWRVIASGEGPLIEPNPALTEPHRDRMYLDNIVFTTGMVDAGDHWIVASGEADLACRITHVPKGAVG
ncbi:glycosidase [uncultured Sphingomonas sp.]|uniref:glycoside hydrolase family 130 protein n=1 Tax=uncultured Sphingomonas sp. TaxID=158754 RepID=UPI002601E596|nr:glycosidase [uncultured Sphingomonas sp.]